MTASYLFFFFTFSLSLLLWIGVLWSRVGYYLWMWQIKEYRLDRLLAAMREPNGIFFVFPRWFFVKVILLLVYPFFTFLFARYDALFFIFTPLIILYAVEVFFFIKRTIAFGIKFPRFTVKSVALFILSFFSVCGSFIVFFSGYPEVFLLFDIFTVAWVTGFVFLFKPFTYMAKQYIVMRAKKRRALFSNLIAIGITGSFGKTSVKEFLAHILLTKLNTVKTKEHQNTEIGAARAILRMKEGTEILVAEMAAYRKGDIQEISEVVKPTMGIITGIGPQHLALFRSMETIVETKFELAEVLPKDGALILNWDNEFVKSKIKNQKSKLQLKIQKFSVKDKDADIWASDIEENLESLEFIVHHKNEKEIFKVNLLGKHNVGNILAATAAALECGMTLKEIAKAVQTITALAQTMRLYWGEGNIPIIDDSYNGSIDGVRAAIDYITLYKDKKRILIMPSLIELGDKAFLYHEELGKEIANHFHYAFIIDNKYQKAIWQGWKSVNENDNDLHFHSEPRKCIEELKQVIDQDSVILIEGRAPKEIKEFLLNHKM